MIYLPIHCPRRQRRRTSWRTAAVNASVAVFDAYGTLFDVHSAVARFADALDADAARISEIWRQKQLEYT